MTILKISDLKSLMDVSFHKRDETITASIEAVERSYVKEFLGNDVFVLLLKNSSLSPSNSLADLIINGGFYEDSNSPHKEYFLNGLNKAISLLSYSDLLIKQTIVTRYGAVNKNDTYSVKPDFSSILEQISRYRKTAMSYLEDIDFFLRNIDDLSFSQENKDLLTDYRKSCFGKHIEGILNEWI